MADLETHADGGALWVRFNRPDAFNALTSEMADGFTGALADARSNDEIRVVVVTGTGAAFCAGADITGPASDFDDRTMHRANQMIRGITALAKPVVAAVNGVAAGVGAGVALAADVIIARDDASFLLAFARVGLMPDGGTTATVAASIGRARAMRMALLAEPLSASDALAAGLVTQLAGVADFDEQVAAVVRRLARGPALAFAATKKAINAATLPHLEAALEREATGQQILFRTHDVAEGVAAFTEKRRPDFTGS